MHNFLGFDLMPQSIPGFWRFRSSVGEFSIRFHGGYWVPFFEDENLGDYHSPEVALDELVGGSTFMPSNGVWPADLEIPESFSEWEFVPSKASV